MPDEPILRTADASKGVWRNIERVQGRMTNLVIIPPTKTREELGFDPKAQVEFTLEDAMVLGMKDNEPAPELRDDIFRGRMNYADPGALKAPDGSSYVKGFLTSGEELGIMPEYKGKVVTLEWREKIDLGYKLTNGEPALGNSWIFVGGEDSAFDIDTYLKEKLVGMNQSTAMRFAVQDVQAKRHYPNMLASIRDGSIAEKLGLVQDPTTGVYLDNAPETVEKAEE